MSTRTFIALDLDDSIVDGLVGAQERLANPEDNVNWVERGNLHVTLKFLGDVPDDQLAQVCEVMAAAAARVQPFSFDVRGLIITPPHGPIRMVWGHVNDSSCLMGVLHDEIDKEFAQLGFKEENRLFRPHITMARVKHIGNVGLFRGAVRTWNDFDFGFQHCDEVIAYTSILTDEGPVYTPLGRAPVGG